VPRQLEQPHDAYDGEEFQYVRVLQVRRELLQRQVDVEAQRGYVVDDVHGRLDELALVRRRDEPHQYLEREPRVAHALDVEERLVRVRLRLVQHPRGRVVRRAHRDVLDDRHAHVRVRLQAERQDRHAYEEHGHDADDLKPTKTNVYHPSSLRSRNNNETYLFTTPLHGGDSFVSTNPNFFFPRDNGTVCRAMGSCIRSTESRSTFGQNRTNQEDTGKYSTFPFFYRWILR